MIARNNKITELRIEKNQRLQIKTISKACELKTAIHKVQRFKKSSFRAFSDRNITALKKKNKTTLIYIWSPEMINSVQYHNEFAKMAKAHGFDFISVVDSISTAKEVHRIRNKYAISHSPWSFASDELLHRGGTLHYPTSFLVFKGKLLDNKIVGVVDRKIFDRSLGVAHAN